MKQSAVAALAAAIALTGTAVAATPAHAEPAIFELFSGSSLGSSKPDYYPDYDKGIEVPEKRPLESSYTGNAPISLGIAVLATLATIQVIVDFVPPVRAAVDDIAAQLNLAQVPGSSEGNRIIPADQIKAFVQSYIDEYLPQK